jgi:hypothetical protein
MPAAQAAPRILDLEAPTLHIEAVTISQGANFCFTTDSPQGVDPVAYLLGPDGLGGWTQLAYHDDVNYPSDPDVQLCWTNNTVFTTFLVVLRAWSPGASGLTTTTVQGQAPRTGVPVGGIMVVAGLLQRQPGDVVRTSHVPGGSVAQVIFRMNGVYDITQMALSNSTAQSAELVAASNDAYYLLGTPSYVTSSESFLARSGPVRLTSNDASPVSDDDEDGLGNALEQELETCWQVTGCANAANGHGRDTDRDGVDDYEELYGIAGTDPDGLDDVDLPRWGADPLKKDIFIEVDHLAQLGTLPLGTNPFQWMRDNPTSPIGTFAAGITPEAWVDKLQLPFDSASNSHVHNPNNTNGVQVHLDLGVQPILPDDERKFGDWGGLSQRMVVEDRRIEVDVRGPGDPPGETVTVGTFVTLQINESSRTFSAGGMNASDICYGLMFQLLMIIIEDGEPVQLVTDGCAETKPWFRMGTSQTNVPFEVAVGAAPAIGGDPLQAFFAVGGLGNEELTSPTYWKSTTYRDLARRGRIRYAIVSGLWGGGKGSGVRFVAGLDHAPAFTHELGHTLALQHWGHDEWETNGVDCIPHYRSLMRYGSPYEVFADAEVGWTLNPAATVETQTFGTTFDHSIFAAEPYQYPVPPTDFSHVDWNRDGVAGDATTGYRSLSLATPGDSCRSFVQGAKTIAAVAEGPTGAVDLQRIGNRLYAFWIAGGQHLRYRFADLALGNTKACAGSADPKAGDCLTWSAVQTLVSDTSTHDAIFGITAAHYDAQLFLATRSAAHGRRLRVWRCDAAQDGTLSIIDQTDAPEHPALLFPRQYRSDFAPELVVMHRPGSANQNFGLGLLYLDADGAGTVHTYRSYGWDGTNWVHLGAMIDTAGNPIQGRRPPAAKAWPGGELGWSESEKRTLAILTGPDDRVRVYELEHASDRWFHLDTLDVDQGSVSGYTTGRPFLEFRPVRNAAGQVTASFDGHLMVGWLDPRPNEGDVAYLRFSTILSRTKPPSIVLTLPLGEQLRISQVEETVFHDWVQNIWASQAPGTTVALYGDPQLDNVFGLTWIDTGDSWSSGLYFLPHADGSPNSPLTVKSDFRVMEDGICEGLLADGPPYAPSCGALDNHTD